MSTSSRRSRPSRDSRRSSATRRPCSACWPGSSRSPRPTAPSSLPARPAPARSSWRGPSTITAAAGTGPWSASTAARSRPAWSRASSSGTRRARSPARWTRKIGRFELADGGTIFLDEIGELPLDLQVKLLRVLQERRDRAGRRDEADQGGRARHRRHPSRPRGRRCDDGRFRADLYYRLNVFPHPRCPPLRERPGGHPAARAPLRAQVRLAASARPIEHDPARDARRPHQLRAGRATSASWGTSSNGRSS